LACVLLLAALVAVQLCAATVPTFTAGTTISSTAMGGKDVFAVDMDADGDVDILAASSSNDQVRTVRLP
jgi:glycine cleavage system protein P-like pyridoxal-binding family